MRRHWIEKGQFHGLDCWEVSRRSFETDQWITLARFDSQKLAEGWVITIEQRQDDLADAAYRMERR